MLGRSRAAHRSAAPATAARGTGTAGGDPAAGTGDGALSTPAAMVAAAADLPVRSLRANSSATLSCPAVRPSTGLLNRGRLLTVGWRSPVGRSCISINTKNRSHGYIGLSKTTENVSIAHFFLAAGLAQLSRIEEARAAIKTGLALNPMFTINRFRAGTESDNLMFASLMLLFDACAWPPRSPPTDRDASG